MSRPADPTEALRAAGFRVTPQRRAILIAFGGGRSEHLSADEVFERVRGELPTVSRATVYSTLTEFVRGGLLASVGRPEAVGYESNVDPHDHFRCTACGRRFDVEPAAAGARAAGAALEAEGFTIERALLTLEGTCGPCAEFARGLRAAVAARRRARAAAALESLLERLGDVAVGSLDTPLGPLHVAGSNRGLIRVVFPDHADRAVLEPLVATSRAGRARHATARAASAGATGTARRVRDAAVAELTGYFDGARRSFDVPVDWDAVGTRHRPSLQETLRIPYGGVRPYHQVGGDGAAAAIGSALGANPVPIVLPCHRVWRAADDPVDYTGGVQRKRALRALEQAGARG